MPDEQKTVETVAGAHSHRIEVKDHESIEAIAAAMKKREPIIIATDDKEFNPLGYDRHSAEMRKGGRP